MNIQPLLNIAITASEQACSQIVEVYNSGDFQAELKGDNSPLTIADRRAHDVIVRTLEPTGIPILSEEGRAIPYQERKDWEYFWLVDPLDGTKEFLKRNGEFTVNIALIHNSTPILGVVAVPVSGDIYYAAEGEAYLRKGISTIKLAHRGRTDLKREGLRVVASRSHMSPETQAFVNQLKNPSIVSSGSSLKFMMLASGVADVYPRFAPTMEWDTGASQAIVNAVGLKIFRQGTDEELVYNKENLLNPGFVVC